MQERLKDAEGDGGKDRGEESSKPRRNFQQRNLGGVDNPSMVFVAAESVAEVVDSRTVVIVAIVGIPSTAELFFDWFMSVSFELRAFPKRF